MQKKSKISIFIIGLVIVLTSIGLSYAYWKTTIMGDKGNNVTSGCFNVEMINQKDEITLGSTFPITDAEGLKLKPFSFTLKNTCTIFAHYYVNMEMLEGTTLNSKFVAARVNNEAINTLDTYKVANTTINTSTESRTIAEGYLGADEEVDYTVSFWMDEDATIDDDVMNKVFKSKIVINSEPGKYDPVSAGYDTLHDAILANEYQTTPEIAKTKISNKQAVDLSNTAPIIKWIEIMGNNDTLDITKPSLNSIKIDDQTSSLTENDTKLILYKTKTFDSETGRYTLSDPFYVDPTELTYDENTHYYFQNEYILYDNASKKVRTITDRRGITEHEIIGATKTITTTKWNDTYYESIKYNLSTNVFTEKELESDKSDKGLYQSSDDYGATYYYRGNVKNNNVYFAGFYWQIVRINGDGSIRLIYNGTEKNATGNDQAIGYYKFNDLFNNPAYVGYMYGDSTSTTFDGIHANVNDSTIKKGIDSWYENNIINKDFNNYVSTEVGFCGDRSLYSGDGIDINNVSFFGAYGRSASNAPQFYCPNVKRDLYTTQESTIGNNSLKYPVGMISADEMIFAGIDGKHINKYSYLYSSFQFWTMSPSVFDSSNRSAYEYWLIPAGYIHNWWSVINSNGARPVINLKSDIKITGGTGTANDPFVVDTNN